MSRNPTTLDLDAESELVDLWTIAEKTPGIEVEFDTQAARDGFIFKMHMVRRAFEVQRTGGEPWCRTVAIQKEGERRLRFIHRTQEIKLEFPDGTTKTIGEALR